MTNEVGLASKVRICLAFFCSFAAALHFCPSHIHTYLVLQVDHRDSEQHIISYSTSSQQQPKCKGSLFWYIYIYTTILIILDILYTVYIYTILCIYTLYYIYTILYCIYTYLYNILLTLQKPIYIA